MSLVSMQPIEFDGRVSCSRYLQQVSKTSLDSEDGRPWQIDRQSERGTFPGPSVGLDDLNALIHTTGGQNSALAFFLQLLAELAFVAVATCHDNVPAIDGGVVPFLLQSLSVCTNASRDNCKDDEEDAGARVFACV